MKRDWRDCETLGERLDWAMWKSEVSKPAMASACHVSIVSVRGWLKDSVKNMKFENLFTAAELCMVNAKWLATGEGAPDRGIGSPFADVAGPDLAIARRLSALDDKSLRKTIEQLLDGISASRPATKRKEPTREESRRSDS